MTQETRLRVASNPTRGWQANKKTHLCVASGIRAMPETEKPPAMRVDIYFGKNAELSTTKVYKAYKDVSLFKKTIYGRPFTGNLYRIEKRW